MAEKRSGGLLKPSTRAFVEEARRTPDYSLLDFLHGYFYARWPYLYIGVGVGEHPLAGPVRLVGSLAGWIGKLFPARPRSKSSPPPTFADTYHGKVVPLSAARQLVSVKEPIRIDDLEKVIPYAQARSIILHNPDHIVALDCPCRSAREKPCLPLDVCLIVGEPFAGFIHEHHPARSRWISPGRAIEILEAENARGHVAHAFFKDAMLGRFYAICNCCSCCCGAMQAQRNGVPMLAPSGYRACLDAARCVACGSCVERCPFGALRMDGDFTLQVDAGACMGCGVCTENCPQGALSLARDPSKGEPLEIFQLMEQAGSQTVPPGSF